MRLTFVRHVLQGAHWEGAHDSPLANYVYCTKSNNFECIGDFSAEQAAARDKSRGVLLNNQIIIKGLMSRKCYLQTMVSKEYSKNHLYFDKITKKIKEVELQNKMFNEWSTKKLRMWQYTALKRVMEQDDRKVAWICDSLGNNGKSFLGNYLSILYNFQLYDGQLTTRDLALVLDEAALGICFDVCRSSEHTFDYSVLECLKNGYISTGKYAGRCVRFKPMKIIVFANFYPILNKLSQDRWDLLTIGEGILGDNSQISIVDPTEQFAFIPPVAVCNLSSDFDFTAYLTREGIIDSRRNLRDGR